MCKGASKQTYTAPGFEIPGSATVYKCFSRFLECSRLIEKPHYTEKYKLPKTNLLRKKITN